MAQWKQMMTQQQDLASRYRKAKEGKEMTYDTSCYVCGHAPEEHRNEDSECEFEDGCDCICFEAREDEEEEARALTPVKEQSPPH